MGVVEISNRVISKWIGRVNGQGICDCDQCRNPGRLEVRIGASPWMSQWIKWQSIQIDN